MKTQRSRNSFDAEKRYSGVYQQQGRMLTDADWNELSDLVKERLNNVLVDVVGSGTPRARGMIVSKEQPDGSLSYALRWGYVYVDGIVGQSTAAPGASLTDPAGIRFEYEHQADFPDAPGLPATDPYCLYLDVWDRTVTTLEDSDLSDPGLHGADTCTRTQTMVQVKWCPLTTEPEDLGQNPPIGTAPLTLAHRQGSTEADPCDPCADELSLTREPGNYLFRIEVHDVESEAGLPKRVTLKWSSEGASEQYVAGEEPPGFDDGRSTFEFFSGVDSNFASEKHLGHHLHDDASWNPRRGELHQPYPGSLPVALPNVRRWDGSAIFEKSGTDWTLVEGSDFETPLSTTSSADATGHVTEGSAISVHLDAIDLTLALADHQLLAGDYWEAAVRRNAPDLEAPLLEEEPPMGIPHHYLKLGQVDAGDFTPSSGDLCRQFEFPPLTDIEARDVCYDNTACEMPGVETVKDALDHLCKERDLRWHNKHLHGWGVVCGLQVYCAPKPIRREEREREERDEHRRQIRVLPGYALDCEGNDIVVDRTQRIDLIDLIERHDSATEEPILNDGDGTACLAIGLDEESGLPDIAIEKYTRDRGQWSNLLEGTLLWDFYDECILKVVEALKGQLDFSDVSDPASEDGTDPKVTHRRRTLVSILHLVLQFIFTEHGRYIFISKKGHDLLEEFYNRLRSLLKSETYCAMFEGSEFPKYTLATKMSTAFGKNSHTKLLAHPSGEFVYSYGGANKWVNVYHVESEELVAVHEMPAAKGAEIRALAFSKDGGQLFVAASLHDDDSLYAFADLNGKELNWRGTVILCDVLVTEMVHSAKENVVYAIGKGTGLYELNHDSIFGEEKQELSPRHAFNAVGHLELNDDSTSAYATSSSGEEDSDAYDEIVVLDLRSGAADMAPQTTFSLKQNDLIFTGEDGFTLGVREDRGQMVHVIVNSPGDAGGKQLLSFSNQSGQQSELKLLTLEDTVISPAYHAGKQVVLLALAGSFRLQVVSPDGTNVVTERIPVQIQPQALAIDAQRGNTYALNFASNTISLVPPAALDVSDEFNQDLAAYRLKIIMAFASLAGGLLQYLKDCFCQRLLVDCPRCEEDDKVFLGSVEIRDSKIHKICNFAKRKDVHTFPKVEYWLSLFPVLPLLKKGVEKLCCLVLPNLFAKYSGNVMSHLAGGQNGGDRKDPIAYPAEEVTTGTLAIQRIDAKGEIEDLKKRTGIYSKLATDNLMAGSESTTPKRRGFKKTSFVNTETDKAKAQIEKRGVRVAAIEKYDPSDRSQAKAYRRTPSRIPKGSAVVLYEQKGKVKFYALQKESATAIVTTDEAKLELAELERRKNALADLDEVNSELARLESKRAEVANVSTLRTEVESLSSSKGEVQREVSTLKEEFAALRAEREALAATQSLRADLSTMKQELVTLKAQRTDEEQKIAALKTEHQATARELLKLDEDLKGISTSRDKLTREITRQRPVTTISGITDPIDAHLRRLGIITVEDLAKANPVKIAKTGILTRAQATSLITSAKNMLK